MTQLALAMQKKKMKEKRVCLPPLTKKLLQEEGGSEVQRREPVLLRTLRQPGSGLKQMPTGHPPLLQLPLPQQLPQPLLPAGQFQLLACGVERGVMLPRACW